MSSESTPRAQDSTSSSSSSSGSGGSGSGEGQAVKSPSQSSLKENYEMVFEDTTPPPSMNKAFPAVEDFNKLDMEDKVEVLHKADQVVQEMQIDNDVRNRVALQLCQPQKSPIKAPQQHPSPPQQQQQQQQQNQTSSPQQEPLAKKKPAN